MAIFQNGFKQNILLGLAIGVGSAILAPIVIPILASVAKPVAKATIKGGMMLFERGKELAAEAQETMEDMVAEAKAELAEEQKGSAPVPDIPPEGSKLKS